MAFCSKCGAQVADGTRLCTSCSNQSGGGTALAEQAQPQAKDISKMDKQSLLTTFAEAHRVLTQYESFQDAMTDEVAYLADKTRGESLEILVTGEWKERQKRTMLELKKANPKAYFSGIACLAGGGVLCFLLLNAVWWLGLLCLLAGGISGYILWNGISKSLKKGSEDRMREISPQLEAALTACERSKAVLSIPAPYRYSYAVEQMAQLLQSFRASTWIECADRYEEMVHRMRMEAHAKEAAELAAISAFYAKQARDNARAAAIFSGLNFFL